MLDFLEDPVENGVRWLRNGGVETLASYGIVLDHSSSADQVSTAAENLHRLLSDGTLHWLQSLPLYWKSENLLVTHAGPDPAIPLEGQSEQVFLWGHNRFLCSERRDGLWVAHGHWICERANIGDGRIAVDTGAWRTGRLSAALIAPSGSVGFINTP